MNICLYKNETIVSFLSDDDFLGAGAGAGVGGELVLVLADCGDVVVVVIAAITVADGSGDSIGSETTEINVMFVKYAGR